MKGIRHDDVSGYRWDNASLNTSHGYLVPAVVKELAGFQREMPGPKRVFDLGCGNGSVANALVQQGWDVTGVDPSGDGIEQANAKYPELNLSVGSSYDDLAERYGRFPVVLSLEVVEHLFFPRRWADTVFSLLEPHGMAIVSTPYHGYWKNLALAVAGKMDNHFTALWDYGHIKFWSIGTLTRLLKDAGFVGIRCRRVGRLIPALAKSMIAIGRKPNS